jgi:uncharacterized DUF497 family protein
MGTWRDIRKWEPTIRKFEATEFEWDETKAAENVRKHAISFDTAKQAFKDTLALDWEDTTAQDEQRLNKVAMAEGRLIHVTYTERDDRVRIISARVATPRERRMYHES